MEIIGPSAAACVLATFCMQSMLVSLQSPVTCFSSSMERQPISRRSFAARNPSLRPSTIFGSISEADALQSRPHGYHDRGFMIGRMAA